MVKTARDLASIAEAMAAKEDMRRKVADYRTKAELM